MVLRNLVFKLATLFIILSLTACGRMYSYSLGNTSKEATPTPTPTHSPSSPSFTPKLSLGDNHSCSLDSSGRLKCWGANDSGQAGPPIEWSPRRIEAFSTLASALPTIDQEVYQKFSDRSIVQSKATGELTCLIIGYEGDLAAGGDIFCTGGNHGSVGANESIKGKQPGPNLSAKLSLTRVTSGFNFRSLAMSQKHTCAVTLDGELYCVGTVTGLGAFSTFTKVNTSIPVTKVAVGLNHTCITLSTPSLWCWGAADLGQVGNGQTVLTPFDPNGSNEIALPSNLTATEIAARDNHTCAIDSAGTLYCWGENIANEIPYSTGTYEKSPYLIRDEIGLPFTNIAQVAIGGAHICARNNARVLQCWGKNALGQVGVGTTSSFEVPHIVLNDVSFVATTQNSTCAINGSGNVSCWGTNAKGTLGIGNLVPSNIAGPTLNLVPLTASSLTAGEDHFCAVTQPGLYCYGDNAEGQILQDVPDNQPTPGVSFSNYFFNESAPYSSEQANPGTPVLQPISSHDHTCAIDDQGELFCWGLNDRGQIGNGLIANAIAPVNILSAVTAVTTGNHHTCAISRGALYCWGSNGSGQLGVGELGQDSLTPQLVFSSGATAVSAGNEHTCAVVNMALLCWGNNLNGQVGTPYTSSTVSFPYPTLPAGVTSVVSGPTHTCATDSVGLKCWGNNSNGQIGNNSSRDIQLTPYYTGLNHINSLSLGLHHTCAIQAQELYCWGANDSGQGGVLDLSDQVQPKLVDSGFKNVSAAENTTCAVSIAQELKCFGEKPPIVGDTYPTETNVNPTPTLATGIATNIVSLGTSHTCIEDGGTISCWGSNLSGQLANARTYQNKSFAPTEIFPDGVTDVASGSHHTCAVRNGGLLCWGSNSSGQLALPPSNPRITPYEVFSSGVTAVAAATDFTCAIVNSALYCWGDNSSGELGAGNNNGYVSTPTKIIDSGVSAVQLKWLTGCALVGDSLRCWGANPSNALGPTAVIGNRVTTPIVITSGGTTHFTLGATHLCSVTLGVFQCTGPNEEGKLGTGLSFNSVQGMAASSGSTCVLNGDALLCFGRNTSGEIANGTLDSPVLVPHPTLASGVTHVAMGASHACAIANDHVYCWGTADSGQLGTNDPNVTLAFAPQLVF